LTDPDSGIQEQAFNALKNIADKEDGIDMLFTELGGEVLLGTIATALKSENDDVLCQVSSTPFIPRAAFACDILLL
jgi:armadillo repeat-containing protein 8